MEFHSRICGNSGRRPRRLRSKLSTERHFGTLWKYLFSFVGANFGWKFGGGGYESEGANATGDSERTKKLIKEDLDFSDEIQQEDIDICEKVQLGLNSGSYEAGRLCMKRESGVLHFQNLVRRFLR